MSFLNLCSRPKHLKTLNFKEVKRNGRKCQRKRSNARSSYTRSSRLIKPRVLRLSYLTALSAAVKIWLQCVFIAKTNSHLARTMDSVLQFRQHFWTLYAPLFKFDFYIFLFSSSLLSSNLRSQLEPSWQWLS